MKDFIQMVAKRSPLLLVAVVMISSGACVPSEESYTPPEVTIIQDIPAGNNIPAREDPVLVEEDEEEGNIFEEEIPEEPEEGEEETSIEEEIVEYGDWTGPMLSHIEATFIVLPHPTESSFQAFCTFEGCYLSPRLYHHTLGDGTVFIGYTDMWGDGHVVKVADGLVVQTWDFSMLEIKGLYAHEDESFGVLTLGCDLSISGPCATMWLETYDSAGAVSEVVNLRRGSSIPVFDQAGVEVGGSRLTFGGNHYAAYHTAYKSGHHGDQLTYISRDGVIASGGWSFGCSHSMSQGINYNPFLEQFMPICVSDKYPATGVVSYNSTLIYEAGSDESGKISAVLGQVASTESGWLIAFNAVDRPCCDAFGIGLATIDSSGFPTALTWLTGTDGSIERDSFLARLGDGNYLAGWRHAINPTDEYWLGVMDNKGNFILGPDQIDDTSSLETRRFWGRDDDPGKTDVNGCVSWVATGQNITDLGYYKVCPPEL